jgi:hypothetical protein
MSRDHSSAERRVKERGRAGRVSHQRGDAPTSAIESSARPPPAMPRTGRSSSIGVVPEVMHLSRRPSRPLAALLLLDVSQRIRLVVAPCQRPRLLAGRCT